MIMLHLLHLIVPSHTSTFRLSVCYILNHLLLRYNDYCINGTTEQIVHLILVTQDGGGAPLKQVLLIMCFTEKYEQIIYGGNLLSIASPKYYELCHNMATY